MFHPQVANLGVQFFSPRVPREALTKPQMPLGWTDAEIVMPGERPTPDRPRAAVIGQLKTSWQIQVARSGTISLQNKKLLVTRASLLGTRALLLYYIILLLVARTLLVARDFRDSSHLRFPNGGSLDLRKLWRSSSRTTKRKALPTS